jgi:hypothetical protein
MMKQLLGLLTAVLFVTAAGQAQLPLRNYIGKGKEAISKSLDQLGLKYDVEESEWMDGEVTFTVYPNVKAEDKQENTAEFYLSNDSCYFQQYNFKNDPFVLDNLRDIFSFRSDFSGCDYDPDCWNQTIGEASYSWRLTDGYLGNRNWDILIIEETYDWSDEEWNEWEEEEWDEEAEEAIEEVEEDGGGKG